MPRMLLTEMGLETQCSLLYIFYSILFTLKAYLIIMAMAQTQNIPPPLHVMPISHVFSVLNNRKNTYDNPSRHCISLAFGLIHFHIIWLGQKNNDIYLSSRDR